MNERVPPSSTSGAVTVLDDFRALRQQPRPGEAPLVADLGVEQALIGCVLMHPQVFGTVSALVSAEHFSEEAHAAVWVRLAELAASGETPNLIRLHGLIGSEAWKRDFGGKTFGAYLTDLVGMGAPVHAAEYARTIQQLWQLRELQAAALAVSPAKGFSPAPTLDALYARIDAIRSSFVERRVSSVDLADAGFSVVADIQASLQGEDRPLPSSGIVALDNEIGGGLQPSFLLTIGARTSVGKSVVGVEMARRVAVDGYAAIYHSLEMSAKQVAARVASSRLFDMNQPIEFSRIMKRRGLSQREAYALSNAFMDMRGVPLRVEDGGGRTIGDIAAASDRLANAYARQGIPLGCVVIDHAHIVKPSRAFKREDEGFKEVADGALALAKHLDTTVVLLAQLNRGPEGREDKRPGLVDLRGAGAFEEDSDAVLFLYRPAYYLERSTAFRNGDQKAEAEFEGCKHVLELIIDKNRAGRSNHIVRAWIDVAHNAVRNYQPGE